MKKSSDLPKNKGGRPKKYDTDDLKKLLYEYLKDENPSKVKISDLVKNTGIPIQAWRFNEEIKKEINTINDKFDNLTSIKPIKTSHELLNIPSAEDIVNTNYKNKKKLIDAVDNLVHAYQYSLEKSLKAEELEYEISKLKKQIVSLEENVDFYKNEMKKMMIQSTSVVERKENNIKPNLIDIKQYSETKTTFKDLFED